MVVFVSDGKHNDDDDDDDVASFYGLGVIMIIITG